MQEESYSSIFLLTSHNNGSLNLWHLSVESKFSTILNISHISRMSGHRFRINRIVCHPILPLLLSTSHHTYKQLYFFPFLREFYGFSFSELFYRDVPPNGPPNVSANIKIFNSELILWKVNPVGPLCNTGGIRELARINSGDLSAFTNLAWIPAVLPRYTIWRVILF